MGFVDKLKGRKKEIDEATDEPTPAVSAPEPRAAEYVKPPKRKTFSDGVEREWDDESQGWVALKPAGFRKAVNQDKITNAVAGERD